MPPAAVSHVVPDHVAPAGALYAPDMGVAGKPHTCAAGTGPADSSRRMAIGRPEALPPTCIMPSANILGAVHPFGGEHGVSYRLDTAGV